MTYNISNTGTLPVPISPLLVGKYTTRRAIESPLADLILQIIRKGEKPADLYNFTSFTREGRELISPTIFFRNEAGKAIGCLCINRDIHRWKMARDVLEDYLEAHPLGKGNVEDDPKSFVQDVEGF